MLNVQCSVFEVLNLEAEIAALHSSDSLKSITSHPASNFDLGWGFRIQGTRYGVEDLRVGVWSLWFEMFGV